MQNYNYTHKKLVLQYSNTENNERKKEKTHGWYACNVISLSCNNVFWFCFKKWKGRMHVKISVLEDSVFAY